MTFETEGVIDVGFHRAPIPEPSSPLPAIEAHTACGANEYAAQAFVSRGCVNVTGSSLTHTHLRFSMRSQAKVVARPRRVMARTYGAVMSGQVIRQPFASARSSVRIFPACIFPEVKSRIDLHSRSPGSVVFEDVCAVIVQIVVLLSRELTNTHASIDSPRIQQLVSNLWDDEQLLTR